MYRGAVDRKRRRVWIAAGTASALAGLAAVVVARTRRERDAPLGPSGVVEGAPPKLKRGKGKGKGLGIDVDRLRDQPGLEPAVEYLTYIQVQRGMDEHLMFVRDEDLEAMAALEGDDVPGLVERLRKLGVVVSRN